MTLHGHRKSTSARLAPTEMAKRKKAGILVPESRVGFGQTSPRPFFVKLKPDSQRQRVKKILAQMQYQGFAQFDDIFAQVKRAESEGQFKEALEGVMDFVSQREKVGLMSDAQVRDLFKWLSRIVFHEIEDPPDSVVYSDVPAIYSCAIFSFLHLVHQIVVLLVVQMKRQIRKELVSESFVRRVILMLRSPSLEEQSSLALVVHRIFEVIPEHQDLIMRSMARLVVGYREGLFSYFCVNPVLQFFIMHYRRRSVVSVDSLKLFKLCVFPLFATPFVYMFYQPLAQMATMFHKDNPDLAFWCLGYLLTHWPITCANKEALFLHHLKSIAASIKVETNEGNAAMLFRRIARSIESDNFKVSKAALDLVLDQGFIATYGGMRGILLPIVLPAIRNASRHWADEVRETAQEVMNSLYMFDSRAAAILTSEDIRVQQVATTKQGWAIVSAAAHAADSSIDPKYTCLYN